MAYFTEEIKNSIRHELKVLWAAHHAVGLKGKMSLYTLSIQEPWRSKESGLTFWFGPDETETLFPELERLYNEGMLPNSPLLLNPIVHDENGKPLGSGVIWATGFALGIENMNQGQRDRIQDLKVFGGVVHRGEKHDAGLKMLAFSDKILPPLEDGVTVAGCREIFEIANFTSDLYYRFYLLSGITYLGKHGGFLHPSFYNIIPADINPDALVASQKVNADYLKDAFTCWKAYDRHHSLYQKFGVAPGQIDNNLKFYNLCARGCGAVRCHRRETCRCRNAGQIRPAGAWLDSPGRGDDHRRDRRYG